MKRSRRLIAMLLLVAMLIGQFPVLVMAQSSDPTSTSGAEFEGTDKLTQDTVDSIKKDNPESVPQELETEGPSRQVTAPMQAQVAAEVGEDKATLDAVNVDESPAPPIAQVDSGDANQEQAPAEPSGDEDACQHVLSEPHFDWTREIVTWRAFCAADPSDEWEIDSDGFVTQSGVRYVDPVLKYSVRVQSLTFDPDAEGGPFVLVDTIKEYRYTAKVSGKCAVCGEEVAPFDAMVQSKVLIAINEATGEIDKEKTKPIMEEYIGQELFAAVMAPGPGDPPAPSFAVQKAMEAYEGDPNDQEALQAHIQSYLQNENNVKAIIFAYTQTLEGKMLIAELQNAVGSTIYTAMYSPNPEAGENAHWFIDNMDATKELCLDARNKMYAFNAAFPQYFGAVTPFWANKAKSEHGFGEMDVIKTLFNQDDADVLPYYYAAPAISAVGQGFISYVVRYGSAMDAMLADAMSVVHEDMTDIQKALVLHDWMAKYASFDMQSLVNMAEGTGTGDPISMTAFGTLLHDTLGIELEYDQGGVCLGYAAAYVLLLQTANLKANGGDFASFEDFQDNPVADFVGIRFLVDIEESSVAAGDSGFGEDGVMFNSPHFFNAVKSGNKWYIVDASYNDVHTETLSQQRVETDGSISHGTFMVSPLTNEEMFDGKFQYMDSLYDGSVWVKQYAEYGNPEAGYMYTVSNIKDEETDEPMLFTYEEAVAKAQEKFPDMKPEEQLGQIFTYYKQIMLDSSLEGYVNQPAYDDKQYAKAEEHIDNLSHVDIAYNDISYEEAWFSYVTSEIAFDENTMSFYYVSNPNASYAAMMRMMKQMGDDFGDILEGMDMEAQRNQPKNADQIRMRPVGALDEPEDDGQGSGGMPGMGGGFSQPKDSAATTLFHYGYGAIGYQAQSLREEDEAAGFDMGGGGETTVPEEKQGPFYQECMESKEYKNMYPDLAHTLFVNEGKVYFNVGRKIFTISDIDSDGDVQEGNFKQFKEYNDITYSSNGNPFTGMSFFTDPAGSMTLRYHPIAAICLKNEIEFVSGEDGAKFRKLEPAIFVSIGTNFSKSYKGPNGDQAPYAVEAVNYNPSYNKFMDDGSDPDVNTNDEFMWCANVVDKMVLATALSDTQMVDVTVDPWCEKDGFTEPRSATYGLSDGTAKVVDEGTALKHDYEWSEKEQTYVCKRCLHCDPDYTPEEEIILGDVNGDNKVNTTDAMLLRKYIANPNDPSIEIDLAAADMNKDGKINSTDVMLLRKQIAN